MNKDGETHLHCAVVVPNNITYVKFLIQQGADVNTKNSIGETPSENACKSKSNFEIIKFFIEGGATANSNENPNMNPLYLICNGEKPYVKIAKLPYEHGANVNPRDHKKNSS